MGCPLDPRPLDCWMTPANDGRVHEKVRDVILQLDKSGGLYSHVTDSPPSRGVPDLTDCLCPPPSSCYRCKTFLGMRVLDGRVCRGPAAAAHHRCCLLPHHRRSCRHRRHPPAAAAASASARAVATAAAAAAAATAAAAAPPPLPSPPPAPPPPLHCCRHRLCCAAAAAAAATAAAPPPPLLPLPPPLLLLRRGGLLAVPLRAGARSCAQHAGVASLASLPDRCPHVARAANNAASPCPLCSMPSRYSLSAVDLSISPSRRGGGGLLT